MNHFVNYQYLLKFSFCFIICFALNLKAQGEIPELIQSPLALITSVPEELTSNDIKNLKQIVAQVTEYYHASEPPLSRFRATP